MENILFSTFLQEKSKNNPTSVSILVYDKLISFSNVVEDSHRIQAVNVLFMAYVYDIFHSNGAATKKVKIFIFLKQQ